MGEILLGSSLIPVTGCTTSSIVLKYHQQWGFTAVRAIAVGLHLGDVFMFFSRLFSQPSELQDVDLLDRNINIRVNYTRAGYKA